MQIDGHMEQHRQGGVGHEGNESGKRVENNKMGEKHFERVSLCSPLVDTLVHRLSASGSLMSSGEA